MSSQQKRVVWVAAVSLVLLIGGIVMAVRGNGRYDQTLQREVDASVFAIRHAKPVRELDVDDFAHKLAFNGLIFGLGAAFAVSGTIGLFISAAVWIKKPAPGSVLTLRGWKSREERGERAIVRDKAWNAALFGFFASGPWVLALCVGAFRLLVSPSRLATDLIVILLIECGLFYGWGIHLCRRRDRDGALDAKGPWKVALILNYGGLCVFLAFMGVVLTVRARG